LVLLKPFLVYFFKVRELLLQYELLFLETAVGQQPLGCLSFQLALYFSLRGDLTVFGL
jgi:hypothetical protein